MKDRTAMNMLEYEMKAGRVYPGDFIVESTSGNTGISLAMAANAFGCKAILTMPDKMSKSKANIMSALGAQVVRTDSTKPYNAPEAHIGVAEAIKNIINYIAEENEKKNPGKRQPRAHYMNQYKHPANPHVHYHVTAEEVLEQTGGKIDALVMVVGTGGSITGLAAKLKEKIPSIQVIAVEPQGSIIANPDDRSQLKPFQVEGIGKDFRPTCLNPKYIDRWVRVSDKTSFACARLVMRTEGLMVGGSCGCALGAAVHVASTLHPNSRIVVVLPDSIRNYLNTYISNDWLVYQGYVNKKIIHSAKCIMGASNESLPVDELKSLGDNYLEVNSDTMVSAVLQQCQIKKPKVLIVRNDANIIIGVVPTTVLMASLACGDLDIKTDCIKRAVIPNTFAVVTKEYIISEVRMLLHLLSKGMLVERPVVVCVRGSVPNDLNSDRIQNNRKITTQLSEAEIMYYIDLDTIAAYELGSMKF